MQYAYKTNVEAVTDENLIKRAQNKKFSFQLLDSKKEEYDMRAKETFFLFSFVWFKYLNSLNKLSTTWDCYS